MALPKFIITMDGYLRLGMVRSAQRDASHLKNQHKDLLIGDDSCIGGGYYQFDWASNRLLLDRASYDFGRPRWHLLETLKVPASYRGLRIVYLYDDDHEDLTSSSLGGASAISSELDGARLAQAFIVSDELEIEYYE